MARYRGLWLPALLIVVGAIALAANLNLISWEQLYRLFDLWPLVLILIGAELVLRSVASPRVAATAGLIVLLAAVAAAGLYVALAPPIPAGGQALDRSAPVGSLTHASLSISFGGSRVKVHGESLGDTLYQAHIRYAGPPPRITYDAATGDLSIGEGNGGFIFGPFGEQSVDLAVNDSLPWSLDISGGASNATLDLSTVRLTGVNVSGGANHVSLALGRPQGTLSVDISGGASSVKVTRPSGVAARVEASGGANSVRLDNQHLASFGDARAQTPGYDSATDRYDISVSGGASDVSVTSVAEG